MLIIIFLPTINYCNSKLLNTTDVLNCWIFADSSSARMHLLPFCCYHMLIGINCQLYWISFTFRGTNRILQARGVLNGKINDLLLIARLVMNSSRSFATTFLHFIIVEKLPKWQLHALTYIPSRRRRTRWYTAICYLCCLIIKHLRYLLFSFIYLGGCAKKHTGTSIDCTKTSYFLRHIL